ncbi:MAG: AraC family transcriptional regulator, partial [Rhodopila sp.]|nr:AraC family transcriptional regulator [Rhodopila sp.]
TPVLAAAELACFQDEPGAWEEIALDLVGKVMSIIAENPHSPPTPTRRDEKRIATVLHCIEAEADQALSLADLARDAAMSPYHFLRTFRHVVGMTPHRFILRTRLRNAAVHLRRSSRPVLDIALDAGFTDLSTFNRQFRTTMGMTPTVYRRRGAPPGRTAAA